jgi:hypothetical protein
LISGSTAAGRTPMLWTGAARIGRAIERMHRGDLRHAGWPRLRAAIIALLCAAFVPAAAGDGAAALRERYAALSAAAPATPASQATQATRLDPLGLPIFLLSTESDSRLEGEVWARVDHPIADLRHALLHGSHWCEILILHPNVKYCRAAHTLAGEALHVGIGRKTFQALDDAYWVQFDFRATGGGADPLRIELRAPSGPLSTRNYRLTIEATALAASASVLHLSYGYSFGAMGRLAMQSYLATLGRDKVGFSVTGRGADGQPVYIGGMRGVVERNAMRYFLAIDTHLATGTQDGLRPLHGALRLWFESSERYARQLHELERSEYLDLKVREVWRQRNVVYPPATG